MGIIFIPILYTRKQTQIICPRSRSCFVIEPVFRSRCLGSRNLSIYRVRVVQVFVETGIVERQVSGEENLKGAEWFLDNNQ